MPISNETREKWNDKIKTIFEAYNYGCIELTKWEQDFIESIEMRINGGQDLTFPQSSTLTKIYNKIG